MKNKNTTAQILLLLVAIIWGSGFIAASVALDYHIPPFTMMAIRFSVASIVLLAFFWKRIIQNKIIAKYGIIVGVFLFLAFALQTFGLSYTTAAKNAFLTAMNVIFVPILTSLFYKKRPSNQVIFAALMSFIGVGLLTLNSEYSLNIGDLLSLLCGLMFAAHIFSIGHFSKGKTFDVISFVFFQFITAAILSIIMMFAVDDITTLNLEPKGLLAALYLGLFSTLLAFFMQNYSQKYVDASRTSIILANEAVFATLMAFIILKESISLKMAIGSILVFSAIILSDIKFKKGMKDNHETTLE